MKNKFRRPDLVVGHMREGDKENAVFTAVLAVLAVVVYALFIVS